MIKKVEFEVSAKEYFDTDFSDFERIQDDDKVLVTINFADQTAEYIWYGNGESPANFPAEEDDFEGVVKYWEKLKEEDKNFIFENRIEYEAEIESTLDQALNNLDVALAEVGFDWDGIDTVTRGELKTIDYYKNGRIVFSLAYQVAGGYLYAYSYY